MRQASLIDDIDAIVRFIEPNALEMLAIHVQSRIALVVKLDSTEIRNALIETGDCASIVLASDSPANIATAFATSIDITSARSRFEILYSLYAQTTVFNSAKQHVISPYRRIIHGIRAQRVGVCT